MESLRINKEQEDEDLDIQFELLNIKKEKEENILRNCASKSPWY